MSAPVVLRILTEAGIALEDQAVSIVVPGKVGYLGVLHHHAPLVTTVQSGRLIWQRVGGERRSVDVEAGLCEVAQDRCTLLTRRVTEPVTVAREGRV